MTANPNYYPEDFPEDAAVGTQAVQASVATLESEVRRTAVQTLYGRRQNAQGATRIENTGVVVIGNYMPLPLVGQAVQTAQDRIVGDAAFFIAAAPDDNSIDEISLQNLIMQPSGSELLKTRSGVGCFHSGNRGYVMGGTNWYTEIQQIKHTRTETRYRWV